MNARSLSLFLSVTVVAFSAGAQQPRDVRLVLTHAAVVDVALGTVRPNQTLIVKGRRIESISSAAYIPEPKDRVLDTKGAFVIPGLWDMHAHDFQSKELDQALLWPLELANGVTGVRIMWGSDAALRQRSPNADTTPGPKLVVGSPPLDGRQPMWAGSFSVTSDSQARRLVDSLVPPYSFIKVYQFLEADVFTAIANEARRKNVAIDGHLPTAVSPRDAVSVGLHTFEHGIGLSLACSRDETTLRAQLVADMRAADTGFASHAAIMFREETAPIAGFDLQKCTVLMRDLARANVRIVPTLTLWQGLVRAREPGALRDPRMRYVAPPVRAAWRAAASQPDTSLRATAVFEQMKRLALLASQAGVPLLAGTDAFNPFVYAGFGLHEELALMVASGLTPLQALRTATLNPAIVFGATDYSGTVTPGKIADLVLLDGNPLENIGNTRRIRAVVLDGRLLTRSKLDSLLTSVERAAKAGPR